MLLNDHRIYNTNILFPRFQVLYYKEKTNKQIHIHNININLYHNNKSIKHRYIIIKQDHYIISLTKNTLPRLSFNMGLYVLKLC